MTYSKASGTKGDGAATGFRKSSMLSIWSDQGTLDESTAASIANPMYKTRLADCSRGGDKIG